ncbi:MAG: amino acid--tRNA ligase-related protein [bacterium]
MLTEKEIRSKKVKKMRDIGINPYPAKANKIHSIKEILNNFDNLSSKKTVIAIAGRIRSIRIHGKAIFADIEDESGKIQIFLKQDEIDKNEEEWRELNFSCHSEPENAWEEFPGARRCPRDYSAPATLQNDAAIISPFQFFKDFFDMGDFIEARGELFKTKQDAITLLVKNFKMLTKALVSIPAEYFGMKDEEDKLRKRYLDILSNPEIKEMFYKKARFWSSVREFLIKKGFLEVETPVLENTTGGADAKPFITHHNALDMDVYLRISMGELWQKRLMVAGYEKIFEIGRQFRNEGMDAEHLQDYTQMEFYWAYADYKMGMELAEEMFRYVIEKTFGALKFKIRGFDVDLGKEWEIYDYRETVKKYTGVDILNANLKEIEAKLRELKIEYDKKGFNITRGIDNLWKYCRKQIGGPGFLVNLPVAVSPLAKSQDENPDIVQRYQVIIAGSELANGYSELNDPEDQAKRFAEQVKLREAGDEEAQMFDEEFVEALEYGMPPTTGFGMSERVFAFFMDKPARECQMFPLMKPR